MTVWAPYFRDGSITEYVNLRVEPVIQGGHGLSRAIEKTYETVKRLEAQNTPWLKIQQEIESAGIKQGDYEPLYVGSGIAPYRIRFVPRNQPDILSRKFDEELAQIGSEHSLIVQMRCTGYNLFKETKEPDGSMQKIRKSLGMTYRNKLMRVLYLDKYGIELDRPDLAGMPAAAEEIGRRLFNMTG
jgi:hypothetical protein